MWGVPRLCVQTVTHGSCLLSLPVGTVLLTLMGTDTKPPFGFKEGALPFHHDLYNAYKAAYDQYTGDKTFVDYWKDRKLGRLHHARSSWFTLEFEGDHGINKMCSK